MQLLSFDTVDNKLNQSLFYQFDSVLKLPNKRDGEIPQCPLASVKDYDWFITEPI